MRIKYEILDNGRLRDSGVPRILDTDAPIYSPNSIAGAAVRYLSDPATVDINSLTVTWGGAEYRYTRLPSTVTVYEVRPLHPTSLSLRPLTDWIVVTEREFDLLSVADYFETRKREVES